VREKNSFRNVYEELGVRRLINAAGTRTVCGGTRVRPEVAEAMVRASESFVDPAELNRKVGAYIAAITGAEAGMVTSGAASGVVLSLAACMTGTDPVKVRRLPETTGMKDEVVIMKVHRGEYSYLYRSAGARFVEVGDMGGCSAEEVDAAITERTAAVAFLLGPRVMRVGPTLPQIVAVARARGVPVIVDAAAMLPPKENLRRFIREGADLVVFSGGKMIQGPQSTGLLFGRADLVEAARANASPNFGIGRPHKVSRENLVGLYVALRLYIETDEAALMADYRERLRPVVEALAEVDGVRVTIEHDEFNYFVPTAVIQLDPDWRGPRGPEIMRALLAGEPPIALNYFASLDHLIVSPVSLQAGEPEVVAGRLREEVVLQRSSRG
jgi:L-seryl-tRNA(Ser) seleniumtransferase